MFVCLDSGLSERLDAACTKAQTALLVTPVPSSQQHKGLDGKAHPLHAPFFQSKDILKGEFQTITILKTHFSSKIFSFFNVQGKEQIRNFFMF